MHAISVSQVRHCSCCIYAHVRLTVHNVNEVPPTPVTHHIRCWIIFDWMDAIPTATAHGEWNKFMKVIGHSPLQVTLATDGNVIGWSVLLRLRRLLAFAGCSTGRFLGQKYRLDVGQDTTLCDGHARQQFVQLLVVTDGQLKVTGDDPRLLVVTGSISRQFQDFGGQVFQNGSQVDGSAGSDTFSVIAFAEQTMDSAHRKLKSSAVGAALCLGLCFSAFATARHVDVGSSVTCKTFERLWERCAGSEKSRGKNCFYTIRKFPHSPTLNVQPKQPFQK